jgi:hypothetical protein
MTPEDSSRQGQPDKPSWRPGLWAPEEGSPGVTVGTRDQLRLLRRAFIEAFTGTTSAFLISSDEQTLSGLLKKRRLALSSVASIFIVCLSLNVYVAQNPPHGSNSTLVASGPSAAKTAARNDSDLEFGRVVQHQTIIAMPDPGIERLNAPSAVAPSVLTFPRPAAGPGVVGRAEQSSGVQPAPSVAPSGAAAPAQLPDSAKRVRTVTVAAGPGVVGRAEQSGQSSGLLPAPSVASRFDAPAPLPNSAKKVTTVTIGPSQSTASSPYVSDRERVYLAPRGGAGGPAAVAASETQPSSPERKVIFGPDSLARTTVDIPVASAPAAVPASTAVASPAGTPQFSSESEARTHCPVDTVVRTVSDSKTYRSAGDKGHGGPSTGRYMCKKDATRAGYRAATNAKPPK